MKNFKTALSKPAAESHPWALWIWNLDITYEEIEYQLHSIVEKGFGGIAVRPGRDMNPDYLSEDFFNMFGLVLEIAKNEGIQVCIADDFSLPASGVFNLPTSRSTELRSQRLVLRRTEQLDAKASFEMPVDDPHKYQIVAVKVVEGKADLDSAKKISTSSTRGSATFKATGSDWQVLVFEKEYVKDPLGNYVPNVFNSTCVDEYIKNVLEVLRTRFSKLTPSVFAGFINEMPAALPGDFAIPWDDDLVTKYRAKYKKELIKLLPALFLDTDSKNFKVRCHIYAFIEAQMYERFATPLEKYAKKYRLFHWLLTPEASMQESSNLLKDCFAIPGKDFTTVGIQNQEGSDENYPIARALADMNVNEFRRQSITVVGRNNQGNCATVQSLKAEIDQNLLNGPTTILVDGLYFNIDFRNYPKTPMNSFWYSPDWSYMRTLCDYTARMQESMRSLHYQCDVAVLMPTTSILAEYTPSNDDPVHAGMLHLHKVIGELQKQDIHFDIISEETLLSCSIRANGEFGTADRIRKGNYHSLVLPYSRFISKSVFVFLEKLAAKKGNVVFVDNTPAGTLDEGMNASFNARVDKLLKSKSGGVYCVPFKSMGTSIRQSNTNFNITVHGKKCPDIYSSLGSGDGFDLCALHNISETHDYYALVEVDAAKYVYLIDCESGALHEVAEISQDANRSRFNVNISCKQTLMFLTCNTKIASATTTKDKKPDHPLNVFGTKQRTYRLVLRNQWHFDPQSYNILPLAAWNTRIGLSREFGGYSHYYEAYYEVKEIPQTCYLVLTGFKGLSKEHQIDQYLEVTVNGSPVEIVRNDGSITLPGTEGEPPVVDPMLENSVFLRNAHMCDIADVAIKGYNRVSIRTVGIYGDPPVILYPPYVAGIFSIIKGNKGWGLNINKPQVGSDSWAKYGYPYMSGIGRYRQIFEIPSNYSRLVLKFARASGQMKVNLNGKDLGPINWHPLEVDITDACTSKRNELIVEVCNSSENVLRMNRRASGITGDVYLDVY
ncbi:MAG: hypothetical protein GF398_00990 [Chitinivibrionales bacterium]|nr:hypothetical protein [Chitinivibrionales bacterium]